MTVIASQISSATYHAIADDTLKDEDNGIWLTYLPTALHPAWFERCHWIRWIDRLAEHEQVLQQSGTELDCFIQDWTYLKKTGEMPEYSPYSSILSGIQQSWFNAGTSAEHRLEIEAWDTYLTAIRHYHRPHLTVETIADFETLLLTLGGSCFQLLPYLRPEQRSLVQTLGMVDQCYNILRDLYEDTRQGICYFPQDVLAAFGVSTAEILSFTCFENPGYRALMRFWFEDYLPQLRRQTLAFLCSEPLHDSWQALILWFIHRYRRLEAMMVAGDYNFVTVAPRHWEAVAQDLYRQQTLGRQSFAKWHQRLYVPEHIAAFVGLSPAELFSNRPISNRGLLRSPRSSLSTVSYRQQVLAQMMG